MFNFIKKKIVIPNGETKTVECVETYMVTWKRQKSSYGHFADIEPCYQGFVDKKQAEEFKKSLEDAHKLLRNNGATNVELKVLN